MCFPQAHLGFAVHTFYLTLKKEKEAIFLKGVSNCQDSVWQLFPYRLHNAVQMKQKDKQNISQLEKKLKAEQEARSFVEKQLMEEKKRKKLEEATAARAVAFAAASR